MEPLMLEMIAGKTAIDNNLILEVGAITMGLASDEEKLCGINQAKRKRLIRAGAHVILGDFENTEEILIWLGIKVEKR